jgi:hypothetical protein
VRETAVNKTNIATRQCFLILLRFRGAINPAKAKNPGNPNVRSIWVPGTMLLDGAVVATVMVAVPEAPEPVRLENVQLVAEGNPEHENVMEFEEKLLTIKVVEPVLPAA